MAWFSRKTLSRSAAFKEADSIGAGIKAFILSGSTMVGRCKDGGISDSPGNQEKKKREAQSQKPHLNVVPTIRASDSLQASVTGSRRTGKFTDRATKQSACARS